MISASQPPGLQKDKWRYGSIVFLDNIGTKSKLGSKSLDSTITEFVSKFETMVDSYQTVFNKLNEAIGHAGVDVDFGIKAFSDTIIISLSVGYQDRDKVPGVEFVKGVAGMASLIYIDAFSKNIFLRGAISIGKFYQSARMIVGTCVYEAAEYYELPEWMGISASPSAHVVLSSIDPSSDSLKFFMKYDIPIKNGIERNGWALNWLNLPKVSDLGNLKLFDEMVIKSEKNLVSEFETTTANVTHAIKWRNTLEYFERVLGKKLTRN